MSALPDTPELNAEQAGARYRPADEEQLPRERTVPRRPTARRAIGWDALVVLAIVTYATVFSLLSIARHESFQSNTWDLGAISELTANLRGGHLPLTVAPLFEENAIGLRSYGGLALLTIVGWISPDPRLILVLQAVALGLGAWPFYLLAARRLSQPVLAAALAMVYLLYPPLHLLTLADLHLAAFAIPPLFAAACALHGDRRRAFIGWAVLAAAFQVEALLIVALLGMQHALLDRKWRRGAIIAGVATGIVIVHGWLFGAIMSDVIFGRPWHLTPWGVPTVSLTSARLTLLGKLAIPLLGVPFFGPAATVSALPLLSLIFTGRPPANDFRNWYMPLVIAALFLGTIEGMHYFRIIVSWLGGFWNRRLVSWQAQRWLTIALILATLVGGMRYGLFPPSTAVDQRLFAVTARHRLATAILARIPPTASVSAQNNLLPHLTGRAQLYRFPEVHDAAYVVLDTFTPWASAVDRRDYLQAVVRLLEDPAYGAVTIENGYLLLERGAPHARLAETLAILYSQTYRADDFSHGSGRYVASPDAPNGRVLHAIAPIDGPGFLLANRQLVLPPGSYIATYNLRVDWQSETHDIAALQVAANLGGTLVAERQLTGLDFAAAGGYQHFQLIFSVGTDPVEPRIWWDGTVSIWFDSLQIAPTSATIDSWRATPPR